MNADEVISYYTECWAARFRAGHNPRSHAMHYGLDAIPGSDFEDAKLRMNEHVAEQLSVGGDVTLLDVGCGVGGSAVYFARTRPLWSIWGVDLTPASLEVARENARSTGVADRTTFVDGDYARTPFPRSFHGAYAMESACHAPDKRALFGAVFGVLDPGARFVIVDFFRTNSRLDPESSDRYGELRRGFAVVDYFDADVSPIVAAAGLRVAEVHDLTSRVRAATARSAANARSALAGERLSRRMTEHCRACIAVDALCEAGHLAYRSITLIRP